MSLFDALTTLLLVLLAWRCLIVPDLFRSIVLFVVFGLLLALTWARLDAPDLALAEAAIGAGVLGVLLLGTWRALGSPRSGETPSSSLSGALRVVAGLGSVTLTGLLAWALHLPPGSEGGAGELALEQLPLPATGQPVTAVLLDFRSYDTLLETAVLLMAVVGTWLARSPLLEAISGEDATAGTPVVPALVRLFVPVLLVVGAYLVWAGAHSPGGAFQGGAVLAAAGVLMALGRQLGTTPDPGWLLRVLLILGVLVFISSGLLLMPVEGAFMAYPERWAGLIMHLVEYTLAVSIALSLLLLFTGGPGLRRAF
jgi:multisubunit Na+/H+ antiporter MnhB subunit